MRRLPMTSFSRRTRCRQRSFTAIACTISLILIGTGRSPVQAQTPTGPTLDGSQPLKMEGDIASTLIDRVDTFLLRQLDAARAARTAYWTKQLASEEPFEAAQQAARADLRYMLGVNDERTEFGSPQLLSHVNQPALIARSPHVRILQVSWPTVGDLRAYGLLLEPQQATKACVVALPDADQTPAQIAGLAGDASAANPWALRLAESGCRVLVPTLLSRERAKRNGRAELTNREYIYRSAFELGRHVIGYELQAVLAAVDWFASDPTSNQLAVGVIGYGEGGMLALYAGAIDERIDVVGVSGYFGPREGIWNHPLDRNVFGLLEKCGDAELGLLITPRKLVVENRPGPTVNLPSNGGGPAELSGPTAAETQSEFDRLVELAEAAGGKHAKAAKLLPVKDAAQADGSAWSEQNLSGFLSALGGESWKLAAVNPLQLAGSVPNPQAAQQKLLHQYDRHNQWLLSESPFVRKKFMQKQDTSSVEKFNASNEYYRDFFRNRVIGHFPHELQPPRPRTRKIAESEQWVRYEVVLDVFDEVFAYGILTVPRGIEAGERRPVVVCQHGLEGRPQSVIGEEGFRAYKAFATKLAERGFVTFAPQNIYIFKDRFRTLQRKANPLRKTLFSIMVPQHQQIVDWLQAQPFVDPDRVAFYGLSYGGKSAMRIPALVTDYCLSICSADFNEWVRKNASTQHSFSYVWTGEYEIFEFDLGSTFNYAEMAALIAPRPFMVERGHFDGVGIDEWVAYEFAKVRFLYAARLGLGERCEIEWFVGPHTINGQGSFEFLHRHLDFPPVATD